MFYAIAQNKIDLRGYRFEHRLEDIQTLAYPVFRHRILTNFHAESEGIKSEDIIKRLLEVVPVPKSGLKD